MSKEFYAIIGIGGLALMSISRLIDRHNRRYIGGNAVMRQRQAFLDKVSYSLTVASLGCAFTSFVGYLFN